MKKAATDAVISKITEDNKWRMPDAVQQAVNQFMVDEIAPAVVDALKAEKDGILASAAKAAAEIGDNISKTMIENANNNINGYRGSEIIKKIFE